MCQYIVTWKWHCRTPTSGVRGWGKLPLVLLHTSVAKGCLESLTKRVPSLSASSFVETNIGGTSMHKKELTWSILATSLARTSATWFVSLKLWCIKPGWQSTEYKQEPMSHFLYIFIWDRRKKSQNFLRKRHSKAIRKGLCSLLPSSYQIHQFSEEIRLWSLCSKIYWYKEVFWHT